MDIKDDIYNTSYFHNTTCTNCRDTNIDLNESLPSTFDHVAENPSTISSDDFHLPLRLAWQSELSIIYVCHSLPHSRLLKGLLRALPTNLTTVELHLYLVKDKPSRTWTNDLDLGERVYSRLLLHIYGTCFVYMVEM
jgi:hypothetical protein